MLTVVTLKMHEDENSVIIPQEEVLIPATNCINFLVRLRQSIPLMSVSEIHS